MTGPAETARILAAARGVTLTVVGDVALDEYVTGRPDRLSREAPVPVLTHSARFCRPGGAANPAWNLARAGAAARLLGVVGDDPAALELAGLLTAEGIDTAGLVVDAGRPTTVKTRIVAEGGPAPQQVARIDRQDRQPLGGEVERRLVAALERAAAGASAILVSDYKSGVVTEAVRDAARAAAVQHGIWLTVDSQGDLDRYTGFHLVRAARRDVEAGLGQTLVSESDFRAAAERLRADLGARVVVISRGPEGMSVADEEGYAAVPPANVSEVYDVAGAGDTVIAYLTLALSVGASARAAVALANRAAGLVVRRLGVAAPTVEELLAAS